MANFLETLNAIMTGLGGLAQITNQQAKERQEQELKAADILRQTGDYTFEPTAGVQYGNFMDALLGRAPKGIGGESIVMLGGRPYALKPYGTIAQAKGLSALPTPGSMVAPGAPAAPYTPPSPDEVLDLSRFRLQDESAQRQPQPGVTSAPATPLAQPPEKTSLELSPSQQQHATMAAQKAKAHRLKYPHFFIGNLMAKSSLNPDIQDSPAGAQGIAQFMPGTWEKYGVGSPYDVPQAIDASANYWKYLESLFPNSPQLVATAYNVGEGAVKTANGVPDIPETKQHVQRVLRYAQSFIPFVATTPSPQPTFPAQNMVAAPGAPPPKTTTPATGQPSATQNTQLFINIRDDTGGVQTVPLHVPGQKRLPALLAGSVPEDAQIDYAIQYMDNVSQALDRNMQAQASILHRLKQYPESIALETMLGDLYREHVALVKHRAELMQPQSLAAGSQAQAPIVPSATPSAQQAPSPTPTVEPPATATTPGQAAAWRASLPQSQTALMQGSVATQVTEPSPPQKVHGYEIRQQLFPGEDAYFKSRPDVAGMAADDGKIVLNPYSQLPPQNMQRVAENEAVRLYMREKGYAPDFQLTPEQQALPQFSTGEYSKPDNETARNSSLIARIVTGDPSAGTPTPEQQQWADKVRTEIRQRGEAPASGEATAIPPSRASTVMQQRVDNAQKKPSTPITIPGPAAGGAPILIDLVPGVQQRVREFAEELRNNRTDRAKFRELERKEWENAAESTKNFIDARNKTIREIPAAREYIMTLRNMNQLLAFQATNTPQAYNTRMYTEIMDQASKLAPGDKLRLAPLIQLAETNGMPEAMVKRLETATGYATAVKNAEITGTAPAQAQAKLLEEKTVGPARTANEIAAITAKAPAQAQAEVLKKEAVGPVENRLALEAKEQQATSAVIQEGEAKKAGLVARAQEAERPRGTETYMQYADDILAQAKQDGTLPGNATIKDLSPEQRRMAHDLEEARQGQIKQATANILIDTPLLRKEDLTGYINPLTGQRARVGMTPRQIAESNMMLVSPATEKTIDLRLEVKSHLKTQRLLAFGGIDTDGVVNGKPREKITGFLEDSPPGTMNRAKETVAMRLKALSQKDEGRLVTIFDRNQSGFAGIIGRGLGGQGGQFTENDRIFAESMTGSAGLRGRNLTDARKTMETQFRILESHIDNAIRRGMGDVKELKWPGMPAPAGKTGPTPTTPGATPTPQPAPAAKPADWPQGLPWTGIPALDDAVLRAHREKQSSLRPSTNGTGQQQDDFAVLAA